MVRGRRGTPRTDLRAGADDPPAISRLLVLRSTEATRAIARTYGHVLAAALPADPREIEAALTGDHGWPGPGIVWMAVDHGRAHLAQRRARNRGTH